MPAQANLFKDTDIFWTCLINNLSLIPIPCQRLSVEQFLQHTPCGFSTSPQTLLSSYIIYYVHQVVVYTLSYNVYESHEPFIIIIDYPCDTSYPHIHVIDVIVLSVPKHSH